jgi:DNA-binding NarL/FixJ family response regulator
MTINAGVAPIRTTKSPAPETGKQNVLIVAANRLLRDLLCDRVAAAPEFNLMASWSFSGPDALEEIDTTTPINVVLWLSQISIPKQLLSQIGTIRENLSGHRLVLIGMPAVESIFLTAVRAGVAGYVLDDAPMDEVMAALHLVARGGVACPSQMLPALFRWVEAQPERPWLYGNCNRYGLSRREWQLVPLIEQGLTNKEIASELSLSEQTVKNHLRRMMRKAGAENRIAVVERCQTATAAGV